MQIHVLRGRTISGLTPKEARSSMIISASLARTLRGDADPHGRDESGAHAMQWLEHKNPSGHFTVTFKYVFVQQH